MKVSFSSRLIPLLLIQFFVWIKVFGFASIPLNLMQSAELDAEIHSQSSVAAHDEYVTSSPSSSDKPIRFDSHADDFIEFEEKSERKSDLDFFPVLFMGFLIDYFSSKEIFNPSFLSYSHFAHHRVAIFLLDCTLRI